MTINSNTAISAVATLTEKELFHRFLDAPYYEGMGTSILAAPLCVSDVTIGEEVEGDFFESDCWPADVREFILERLRESNDPSYELYCLRVDILGLQQDVEMLEQGFNKLMEVTGVEDEDDAEDHRYRLPEVKVVVSDTIKGGAE